MPSLELEAKKESIVMADKTFVPINDEDLKRKATEVVDLQPSPRGIFQE